MEEEKGYSKTTPSTMAPLFNFHTRCHRDGNTILNQRSHLPSTPSTMLPKFCLSSTKGRCNQTKTDTSRECLVYKSRCERRVPTYSRASKVPEIHSLHTQGSTLLFPGNALWPQSVSTDVYPHIQISTQMSSQSRHNHQRLHRRLDHLGKESRNNRRQHPKSPSYANRIGFQNKFKEISNDSIPRDYLSRSGMERSFSYSSPHKGKDAKNSRGSTEINTQPCVKETTSSNLARAHELYCPPNLYGQTPILQSSKSFTQYLPRASNYRISKGDRMVGPPSPKRQTSTIQKPKSSIDNLDRCIRRRLGDGMLARDSVQGEVEQRGEISAYHCQGNSCCSTEPTTAAKDPREENHIGKIRQQSSSCYNKQVRVKQISSTSRSGIPASTVCSEIQLLSQSTIHTRKTECVGRPTISFSPTTRRMVPDGPLLPITIQQIRPMADRSICSPRQCKNLDFWMQVPVSSSGCDRFIGDRLESVGGDLSLPSTSFASRNNVQVEGVQRERNIDLPRIKPCPMVGRTKGKRKKVGRTSVNRAKHPKRLGGSKLKLLFTLSRVDFLKINLIPKYGSLVASRLVKSTRNSTTKQYEYCWNMFKTWLRTQKKGKITEAVVLRFFIYLVEVKSLAPQTTRVYKNALSLPLKYGFSINTNLAPFNMLLRQQFLSKPPTRRIIPRWSLRKVLSLLSMPEYNLIRATRHRLLIKTIFLVALASASRVSELAALDRENIIFAPNHEKVIMAVRPGFLYKNETITRTAENVSFPALLLPDGSHHALCPVNALRKLLETTKTTKERSIFLHTKSGKPLRPPQISQLMCSTINTADPGKFPRGHDVRKMGSSLAWTRGLLVSTILHRAFWKTSNVFINKYLCTNIDNDVQCVALGTTKKC